MSNSTFRTLSLDALDGVKVSKNYIKNGGATNNTAGFATYADAAGAAPVDGTGGSPNVTITRSTTSPLSNDASYILTKDAANRQGQGWSYDFSIDLQDRAKALQVEFEYLVNSGTFAAGSTAADSDVTVWLYDVTNSQLIQPTTFRLFANSTSLSTRFVSNFQTSATGSQYRLIYHVSTVSASAYSLKVDSISVSPSQYVYGTPITDLEVVPSATVTGLTGATTTSPTFGSSSVNRVLRGRIGDHARLRYEYVYTSAGTSGTGDYLFSLPTGLAFDSSKVTYYTTVEGTGDWAQRGSCFGIATADFQGVSSFIGTIVPYDSTRFRVFGHFNAAAVPSNSVISSSSFAPIGTSGSWCFDFQAPIAGFSSSVQTSDQADSRVVAASAFLTSTTGSFSVETQITGFTTVGDTHAAFNGTTYTVPVSGWYDINWHCFSSVFSGTMVPAIRINGGSSIYGNDAVTAASNTRRGLYSLQLLRAGDTITFYVFTNASITIQAGSTNTYLSVARKSQASLISATETVAMRATKNSGANTTSGSFQAVASWQAISNPTSFDSHNAFNTTTGVFTCPVAGRYHVSGTITLGVNGTGTFRASYVLKNSGIYALGNLVPPNAVIRVGLPFSTIVQCNAGDTISIATNQDCGGPIGYSTAPEDNQLNIQRIGL